MIDTFSVKKDLSILNAKWLMSTISGDTPSNYMYAFIGRNIPWTTEDEPPIPTDSLESFINSWKNMISLKRIPSTEMTLAIRKIVWTSGTIYDKYDSQSSDLSSLNYYVITSAKRVYKCLNNGNGAQSTYEPTSLSLTPFTTLDGYKWQLMYIIGESESTKWSNENVLPVSEITSNDGSIQWQVQQNAIPGTIDCIEVENGGSGYISGEDVTISITGDGTGASATAILSNGSISSITINNRGSGYTYANISVTGTGSGAVLRAIISPIKGHGSNAVDELCAKYMIVRAVFDKDVEGTFPVDVSFRQIGLVVNPTLYGTDNIASATGGINQMYSITLSSVPTSLIQNEQLINQTNNSTANFVTLGDGNTIYINNIQGTFNAGDTIIGSSSGVTTTISSISRETLNLYSGKMLYTENRQATQRTSAQSEIYKLVIAF